MSDASQRAIKHEVCAEAREFLIYARNFARRVASHYGTDRVSKM
jgi:hypothetical protein